MNNTKALTTAALLVALAAILSLIGSLFPFLMSGLFIIGVPIVIIGRVTDLRIQLVSAVVLLLVTALLTEPTHSLLIATIVLPVSLVQGYLIKKEKKTSVTITYGAVAMFFGFLGFLFILSIFFNVNFVEEVQLLMDNAVEQTKVVYSSVNTYSEEDLAQMFSMLDQTAQMFTWILPSLLIMYSIGTSVISYVISVAIMRRMQIQVKKSYFKDFRIDSEGRLILLVVLGMITLVSLIDQSNASYYIANFIGVIGLIMQINALAFLWYLCENHPNRKAMKIIIAITYTISPMIPGLGLIRYALGVLGFADLYMNFRKRIEARKE